MQTKTQKETDKQLQNAVLRQLEWDPEVVSTDIAVKAEDGVVALTGFVHRFSDKMAAEKAAKVVFGVKAVANDIEVKPLNVRTDPEIARDIVHAMKMHVGVPDEHIKATAQNGFVTLEGTVEWNYQRTAADSCVRNVDGVRGLTNSITVRPKVSPAEVKAKIEDALRRSAEVDARRINVWAHEGTVDLYGNVRSWFEREEAERAAWAAPGVSRVVDHIMIVP